MDMFDIMKEFAKEHGIETDEVDKFLGRYENPTTVEELMALPHDMLEHEEYATYLYDTIQNFIDCKIPKNRHETITLENVVKTLQEMKTDLDEDDEDDKEELEKIRKVEEDLIDTKFGSVVWDW